MMLNVGSSPDVEQERLRWEVTAQQVLILPSHPAGISRRTGVQFHFPVQTRPDVSRALWEPPLAPGGLAGAGGQQPRAPPSSTGGCCAFTFGNVQSRFSCSTITPLP